MNKKELKLFQEFKDFNKKIKAIKSKIKKKKKGNRK
jgi:hypothetical protein